MPSYFAQGLAYVRRAARIFMLIVVHKKQIDD